MLSEKFPGLRMHLDDSRSKTGFWPTGLRQIDEFLHGGLPRGALTEVTAAGESSGSATLLWALLRQAATNEQIATVIDGNDSLDVTGLEGFVLSRLLWLRCHSVDEALKAADLVLRDGNLPLIFLDLKMASKELRKISTTVWYRFQRLIEETNGICLIFTPRQMIAPARVKITLRSQWSMATLDRDAKELLLHDLEIGTSKAHSSAGTNETIHNSA